MMKIGMSGGGNFHGPVIRMAPVRDYGNGGFECCFCRVCTCIHLKFLREPAGLFKILETVSTLFYLAEIFKIPNTLLVYG